MKRKTDYRKFYGDYLRQYEKSKAVAGLAADSKMSFSEFKTNFDLARLEDKRSGGIRIAQQLARDDVYERSGRQSSEIAKYVKEHNLKIDGKTPSYWAIRAGNVPAEFWNVIKQERKRLFESGESAGAVRLIISEQFFGSP